jgi:hypothetical protein
MRGENTFDLLVLPDGHRDMVESLVTQHYLDRASAADGTDEVDIVRGKGTSLDHRPDLLQDAGRLTHTPTQAKA